MPCAFRSACSHKTDFSIGLFHAFGGYSCTGDGDFIDGTRKILESSISYPKDADSCPDHPALNSVQNYKD